MAGDQRKSRVAPIVVDGLHIASRNAAVRDSHQHVTGAERSLIRKRFSGSALAPHGIRIDRRHADAAFQYVSRRAVNSPGRLRAGQ
jgi:hypothetical protein